MAVDVSVWVCVVVAVDVSVWVCVAVAVAVADRAAIRAVSVTLANAVKIAAVTVLSKSGVEVDVAAKSGKLNEHPESNPERISITERSSLILLSLKAIFQSATYDNSYPNPICILYFRA